MDDETLALRLSERLFVCPGIESVALGGSHASGTADARSDIDLGLYYRPGNPPDLQSLRGIVAEIDDHGRREAVTDLDEWGPWVNGGAWIEVDGRRIDLLFRDLERVAEAIDDCRAGRIATHFQVGHPAGFSTQIYAAEVHLCRVLQDRRGALAGLKARTYPYPRALRSALVAGLWESRSLLDAASKSAARGDVHHVAGSAFRAVACMVQALFGLNERYWTNEKASVSLVDSLPLRPEGFGRRIAMILGRVGTGPDELQASLHSLEELVNECTALPSGP
ncbi:MAG: nucleotidyltransferase domain-containing protein [Actinobacteria bacterium]|nr:nucleotidyltransferase domain-containing protein [Actinomycetota bacterium]